MPGTDTVSTDQQHIARIHESFCGGPGASDGWTIGIRNKDENIKQEEEVFITFDSRPNLHWVDNGHLEIEVTGINAINVSERKAKGISISYSLDNSITEDTIRAKFDAEKEASSRRLSKDHQTLLNMENKNADQRRESFLKWAKDYANLPIAPQ